MWFQRIQKSFNQRILLQKSFLNSIKRQHLFKVSLITKLNKGSTRNFCQDISIRQPFRFNDLKGQFTLLNEQYVWIPVV